MKGNALKLKENMELRIVGKGDVIEQIIIALLSEGHVLIEDVPGVGRKCRSFPCSQHEIGHSQG